MKTRSILAPAVVIVAVSGLGFALFLNGPFGMDSSRNFSDYLYLCLVIGHAGWGGTLIARSVSGRLDSATVSRIPDILLGISLILFLFSYIFATNANMDYVQRFAEDSGNLRIAPDSLTERRNSLLRFGPFLVIDLAVRVFWMLLPVRRRSILRLQGAIRATSLPLVLLSSFLYVMALPSFINTDGIGALGYVCLVPLFLVMKYSDRWWGILYGTLFGVVQTMLANFWLGTFSLVSLQFVTIVYLLLYGVFMTSATAFLKRWPRRGILFLPLIWVLFDYLRSLGFAGYPWAMLGVSQYQNRLLIQLASLTGVWGVTLVVLMANAAISFAISEFATAGRERKDLRRSCRAAAVPAAFAVFYVVLIGSGWISMTLERRRHDGLDTFTVSLVQQNTDPRKNDYREGFTILKRLTDEAAKSDPDIVVWSETAFVPNIRRWSAMDPARYYYARLVNELLEYQAGLGTWLLTGNDDYELVPGTGEKPDRMDYNAAVLFDPNGRRVETYRKIHLVPFTEYFPFQQSMPRLYALLKEFDVYLWEPGERRVVFDHPLFDFSTPICFEDGFPNDVRRFVRAGADVIINISNDYWSLSEVEAQQHYANSLFRSVENRRHLLRASASGVTCSIDSTGMLVDKLPLYTQGFLNAEVTAGHGRTTPYTLLGDWLPVSLGVILMFAYLFSFRRKR
jgi:apolipoprotein N-acyltransferase